MSTRTGTCRSQSPPTSRTRLRRFRSEKVICTIRLKAGDQISGETAACNINVDANGDLQEPESTDQPDSPSPILNAKLHGETLNFEEKDGDDVLKFEMKLAGDGQAELRILDAPVPVKPIHFARK